MATDRRVVLDASALLAALYAEPGAEVVRDCLDTAVISTVNLAEVVGKLHTEVRWSQSEITTGLDLPLEVASFDARMARVAGQMLTTTRRYGLSLGDRACLATAQVLEIREALTADAAWTKVKSLQVKVRLIR